VLIKWSHGDGEFEVAASLALRDAAQEGEIQARVINLGLYEMGNVLLRSLGWSGTQVADQREDLILVRGVPLSMTTVWLREATELGQQYRLTFHDALWTAAIQSLNLSGECS
jgi:predicted nucleic acid-binding protein